MTPENLELPTIFNCLNGQSSWVFFECLNVKDISIQLFHDDTYLKLSPIHIIPNFISHLMKVFPQNLGEV